MVKEKSLTIRVPKSKNRNKKKQRAVKTFAIYPYQNQNVIKELSTPSFILPSNFYIGCENELIGDAEYQFMVSEGDYAEGIEVGIYPATESFSHYIVQRMLHEEQDVPSLDSVNWIVVKLKNMLYLDSFRELDEAKEYVRANFPNVKVFRLDSLGTRDLMDGEVDMLKFTPMPDLRSSTQEEWIQFALQNEDELGCRFEIVEAISWVFQKMVNKYQASPNIIDEYYNEGCVESGLDYAAKHGLNGVKVGIQLLQAFSEEYSRIWTWRYQGCEK